MVHYVVIKKSHLPMQKIIIENFGPIKYAEIEVKKILVLIGEQASGKSTIAKLIYFFKSLKDDLFTQIYQDTNHSQLEPMSDIINPIRKKFESFFGSTKNLPDFKIEFYYSFEKNKVLRLSIDENKRLKTHLGDLLDSSFKASISSLKRLLQEPLNSNSISEQLQLFSTAEKIRYIEQLYRLLNELFESQQTDSLFIIAGRNVTVSYSDLFEKYLIQSSLGENRRKTLQRQTIDETLMLKFMEKIVRIKETFRKIGDFSFEGLIDNYARNEVKGKLYDIKNRIDKILKGEYQIDHRGEIIVLNMEQEYVYLSNASSGQQESIRILQDIFINILDDAKVLRILEEPEAHLFPIAQKQLIELLALMVNHNDDNQLIITTHSPYVLTVFNNLLFANRVVEKNPSTQSEVAQIIPQDSWLSAKDFSAYSLGNQSVSEDTKYCEPIFNQEKGTIQQNYLDTVSEILGGDFQALYSIHAKTFKRK
jgi:predicted ATPase